MSSMDFMDSLSGCPSDETIEPITKNKSRSSVRSSPGSHSGSKSPSQRALFTERLGQRTRNLDMEREKLDRARMWLDQGLFRLCDRSGSVCSEDTVETGTPRRKSQRKKGIIAELSEVGKRSPTLERLHHSVQEDVAAIRATLEDESVYEVKEGDDRESIDAIMDEQRTHYAKMCELLDLMNRDVIERESYVIEIEKEADGKRRKIDENRKKKAELKMHREAADEEKANLEKDVMAARKRRDEVEDEMEKVTRREQEEMETADALKEQEARLAELESDMIRRANDLETRRAALDERKRDRVKSDEETRTELQRRKQNMDERPVVDVVSLDELEKKLNSDKAAYADRLKRIEKNNQERKLSLDEQRERLEAAIALLLKELDEDRQLEDLTNEVLSNTTENREIGERVEEKKKEIEILRRQILTDSEIKERFAKVEAERGTISQEEREMNSRLLTMQMEEDEVENDEETLNFMHDDLITERQAIVMSDNNMEKLYTEYRSQLGQATRRYEMLQEKIEQCIREKEEM